MNAMRWGVYCAMVVCMAADAKAQMGTYGAPDPIPLGQSAPQIAQPPAQYAPQYAAPYAAQPAVQYAPQYAPQPAVQYMPQYAPQRYAPQYAPQPAVQYVPQYVPQYAPQYYAPQYSQQPAAQYVPQYAPASTGAYSQSYVRVPAVASRPSYLASDDPSGPTIAPNNGPPIPPAAMPLPPSALQPAVLPPPVVPPVTVQPAESSAVSRMLNEPVPTPAASSTSMMPAGGYMKDAGNCESCGGSACGTGGGCGSGGCGCGGCGCGSCCCPWFFTAEALYMTRNRPNDVYTSAQQSAVVNQGLFNEFNWTPGEEVTLGFRFGCCCEWGVEGTYWGLAESSSDGGPGIPGPYVSPLTFGLTDILGTTGGGGTNFDQTANQFTDGSPNHHTWRNYQAQDVEVSFLRNLCGGDCNCIGVDFIGGFRWFRFQDGLIFGAQRANDGSAYANDWLYLNDHLTNDLLGGQIGFNATWRFAGCWKLFLTPMVGLYDNHMTLDYNLYAVNGATGQQYQASSQTYPNQNYPVHSTYDGFAVLTQVDLGLDWQITQHIATQFGYRLVAATGIGLTDSQIPFYANDTQAINSIQHNGDLILHGAFAGFTFCW